MVAAYVFAGLTQGKWALNKMGIHQQGSRHTDAGGGVICLRGLAATCAQAFLIWCSVLDLL